MIKIRFECVECDEEMEFELEIEPYGWLKCPKCKKKILVDFNE